MFNDLHLPHQHDVIDIRYSSMHIAPLITNNLPDHRTIWRRARHRAPVVFPHTSLISGLSDPTVTSYPIGYDG